MNTKLIILPVLFVLGIGVGAALMYPRGDDAQPVDDQAEAVEARQDEISEHPMARVFVVAEASDSERIEALEQHMEQLYQRIDRLVSQMEAMQQAAKQNDELAAGKKAAVTTPRSSMSPAVSTDHLVKAGLSLDLAADIVRRRNEIDLQILELRDRAAREGYLNSARYTRELSDLQALKTSLRDEIGDDYYDDYLYQSGQSNRVRVASVMTGSSAELAGMRDGDMVLSYDDNRMFSWTELQEATTRGERGEYVNVSVLRNGQLINLWVPRGPLGVRLGSARVQPR